MPGLGRYDASVALRSQDVDDQAFVRAEPVHRLLQHERVEVRLGKQGVSQEVPVLGVYIGRHKRKKIKRRGSVLNNQEKCS